MKKYLKILFVFVLFLLIFFIFTKVKATSIYSINMDIHIDANGNANIQEIWDCNVTKGTEAYHPYYNLGNSKITNFTVTEKNEKYTSVSNWNIDGSLETKKNKSGIHQIGDGVELCWGIGNYGKHIYQLNYTITNFVSELNDAQMIYWTLIPYGFSDNIQKAYIKISSDFKFNQDTTDVWGYGNYGGTAYVYDGYIEMESKGALDLEEYMTILVKFPLGTFTTKNELNYNFQYYYDMAEEGSTDYVPDNNNESSNWMPIGAIMQIIFFFIPFLGLGGVLKRMNNMNETSKLRIDKNWKNNREIPYYRDIPSNKDIFRAYYIAYNYNIIKRKSDILGAVILKWLKENNISIEKREVGMLFKKQEDCIILQENNTFENALEQEIYDIIYEASVDGVLESRELEKWCSRKYTRLLGWFDRILKVEREQLLNEGLVYKEEKKGFFGTEQYYETPNLLEEAIKIEGLKRYLLEYTLIKDREAIEVTLFEEYLIYAQIMGIAETVAKEFKELYPELVEQCHYQYENIMLINTWSYIGFRSADTAQTRAQSYHGGGGGFSSGGGRRRFFRWTEAEAEDFAKSYKIRKRKKRNLREESI